MLTVYYLQKQLCEELRRILSDLPLKRPDGSLTQMRVFEQELPIPEDPDDADAEVKNMPFLIARVIKGTIAGWEEPQIVEVIFTFCVYDNAPDRQGHKDCLAVIHRILARFRKDPRIGNYIATEKVTWALNDEDSHPFYAGAVQMQFESARFVKEDPLA